MARSLRYLVVKAINVGGAATDGSTITIDDSLPPALTATGIAGADAYASVLVARRRRSGGDELLLRCRRSAAPIPGAVDPGDTLIMNIALKTAAEPLAPEEVNDVTVTGGGAAEAR